MQEKYLFEYAVIRVVPRVEREEFVNVGVILYCPKLKFLEAALLPDFKRLEKFAPEADLEEIIAHLHALELIAKGGTAGGPIGVLDAPSRFRWLTALRSTQVQTSRVHPGFCADPSVKISALLQEQAGE
ncbi:DUF3037 domain-containing protein [Pedobacter antarcticus]|uniref:DUF3037 domain-containing protein n=1 Tax=Pedobacter antarcticus TaxID=34086 RepID=UPI0009426AA3|nr:DUF3037 domain-containing protein [Pedobacter antarcticus]